MFSVKSIGLRIHSGVCHLFGYRLPLPKLCHLVQATNPTLEDWEDAMPDDGGIDVNGIGMMLSEKLLTRYLKLTWEHHLITENSLWLVGIPMNPKPGDPSDPLPTISRTP